MITTKVEDAGPCRKKLAVDVAAERVAVVYQETLAAYRREARIPGFRPGNAPAALVERRFGKKIAEDVRDRLLPDAYRDALAEHKLQSVAIVDLQPGDVRPDAAFSFTVTVDVAPDFTLPPYRGVIVRANAVPAVDDAAVDEMIERLRGMQARYEPVEERPAQEHDLARIDFEATLDGKPLDEAIPAAKPLARGKAFQISLDEHAFLPELGKALLGATVGEERAADVTFPDTFSIEELRGMTARFTAQLGELRERILPEPDDALATQVGAASMQELRDRIRAQEQARVEATEERRVRGELARHLVEATTMELPESQVQQETRDLVYSVVQQNTRRGVPQDELVEHKQEIYDQAMRTAREQLALRYVLGRIADEEQIAVSDDEVQRHGQEGFAAAGLTPEKIRERLSDTRVREQLREDLRRERVMEWVRREARLEPAPGEPAPPAPAKEES